MAGVFGGGEETHIFLSGAAISSKNWDDKNHPRRLTAVRRTFYPPVDRGDIKNLINLHETISIDQRTDREGGDAVRVPDVRGLRCVKWETLLWSSVPISSVCALPLWQSIGDNVVFAAITER